MSPHFKAPLPELPPARVRNSSYEVIADWHHYAILVLTFVEDFSSEPAWIASRLSITRLLQIGLLKVRENRLVATHLDITTEDKSTTTAALRRRARQSLEKAAESLERDPLDERCISYLTMTFDDQRMPEARKLIEDFTRKMTNLGKSSRRSRVYEFGAYLFPLQRKGRK